RRAGHGAKSVPCGAERERRRAQVAKGGFPRPSLACAPKEPAVVSDCASLLSRSGSLANNASQFSRSVEEGNAKIFVGLTLAGPWNAWIDDRNGFDSQPEGAVG